MRSLSDATITQRRGLLGTTLVVEWPDGRIVRARLSWLDEVWGHRFPSMRGLRLRQALELARALDDEETP